MLPRRRSHVSVTSPVKVSLPATGEVTLTVIGEEHLAPVCLTEEFATLVSMGVELFDAGLRPLGDDGRSFATIEVPVGTRVYVRGRRVSTDRALELLALTLRDAIRRLADPGHRDVLRDLDGTDSN